MATLLQIKLEKNPVVAKHLRAVGAEGSKKVYIVLMREPREGLKLEEVARFMADLTGKTAEIHETTLRLEAANAIASKLVESWMHKESDLQGKCEVEDRKAFGVVWSMNGMVKKMVNVVERIC